MEAPRSAFRELFHEFEEPLRIHPDSERLEIWIVVQPGQLCAARRATGLPGDAFSSFPRARRRSLMPDLGRSVIIGTT
jgi:hypothetical protein